MKFTESEISEYTKAMDIMRACCTSDQDDDVLELYVTYLLSDCVGGE